MLSKQVQGWIYPIWESMYEIGQVGVCRCLGFLSPCLLADGNETAY